MKYFMCIISLYYSFMFLSLLFLGASHMYKFYGHFCSFSASSNVQAQFVAKVIKKQLPAVF